MRVVFFISSLLTCDSQHRRPIEDDDDDEDGASTTTPQPPRSSFPRSASACVLNSIRRASVFLAPGQMQNGAANSKSSSDKKFQSRYLRIYSHKVRLGIIPNCCAGARSPPGSSFASFWSSCAVTLPGWAFRWVFSLPKDHSSH